MNTAFLKLLPKFMSRVDIDGIRFLPTNKTERIKTLIARLNLSKLAISNLEMKNWAVRFIVNLTAQLRFSVALCFHA